LEKFKLLGEKITINLAIQLCSNISFLTLEKYTNFIKTENLGEAIKVILEIYDKGYSVMDILDNYFLYVKNTTILTELELLKNSDKIVNISKSAMSSKNQFKQEIGKNF
jgi:DNA polymerase III gamma/tau subunit